MMQANEIRQRFTKIEETIHQAAATCERSDNVSDDLKSSIAELDQGSERARQELQQSQDQNSILQCVDDLEALGDRARDACQRSDNIDEALKNAVMKAHQELSELKHQLH
ncbi:MAG: hypothetical protein WBJ21_06940 [Burkholderiaceae bacterium]|jgi:hypothetical protein